MTRKALYFIGSALLAAASVVACAGDGADSDSPSGTGGNTNSGNGGNTNSGNGGNTNSGNGGNTNSGNGGNSNTGTGGSSSGTGGSTNTGLGLATMGGYYKSGDYKGYMFTASDSKPPTGMGTSTILPNDFMVQSRICAKGEAAKVPDMTSYGKYWGTMVGWNIDQADMPPNPEGAKALTGTINVSLSGTVPAGMRVKVDVGGVDYCAPIQSGSNSIPVNTLTKECYLPTATEKYAGQPVKQVAFQVTTNLDAPTPFDFCITALSITP